MLSSRARENGSAVESEPFEYPQADGGNGGAPEQADALVWQKSNGGPASRRVRSDNEAYERGLREGETRGRAAIDAQWNAARAGIAEALQQFKVERESYFGRVEPEVVQLALAMARKILHREAQIDPLLLTGMVHVALEKLDGGTRVRLRTNPADIRLWSDFFSQQAGGTSPELVGDANLKRGECALETELGSTHMSLDVQLKEIEQGFLDLLEQRAPVR